MDLVFFLLFAGLIAVLAMHQRRRRQDRVRTSFNALIFATAEGPVKGSRMKVVKEVIDTMGESQGGDGVSGAFWYCVGPGPSYYVAIAQPVPARWPRTRFQWVLRPLSEDRMRGALASDTDALRAAFGDLVDDTLHA